MAALVDLVHTLSPSFLMEEAQSLTNAPDFLPIVPTSRLWLPKMGEGDDERFAAIFRDTWGRIPAKARQTLVKHWRNCPFYLLQGFWSPTIGLVEDWILSDVSDRQPKDMAVCGRGGHSLYFYAPLVDALPEQHVGELIVHELAHAVEYASGEHLQTDRSQSRLFDEAEIIADDIVQSWGFDPWAIDEWMEKNWKWPK